MQTLFHSKALTGDSKAGLRPQDLADVDAIRKAAESLKKNAEPNDLN